MKALAKTSSGKYNMEIIDIDIPSCGRDEVLVKVKAVGICGTDYHIYLDEVKVTPPRIIGHEFCGEVVKVGSEVCSHKVGDRVVVEICFNSCGVCKLCKTGYENLCFYRTGPGTDINGACCEYLNVPAKLAHKLPDYVDFDKAALIEPTAVAVHGMLERAKIEPEDLVIIFGPGPIGLLCTQLARLNGASKIILVGSDSDENIRLHLGKELGADFVFNINKTDISKEIKDLTDGFGADLVVDCSGAQSAINMGINLLKKTGRLGVIGIPGPEKLQIDWKKAVTKALSVIFSYSTSPSSWEKALSIIKRGAIDVEPLITHRMPMRNWRNAFSEIEKGKAIKVLLYPHCKD